ncbi:hypothetical protein [Embleya scabrispora]|uniref:hypothetical protein n=1 Tax=Embleya scabrispora TaxID=159449 RepID=UPI00037E591F|nr:hypothetical protein [Embleya scabrispora]MYS82356.1 hypothetical protein [Streptomyces sp. SID5474]
MFAAIRRVTGIRRTASIHRADARRVEGGPQAVVVPIVRMDAAAIAALSAARTMAGRAIAVHVTRAGEQAARDALVAAWDASGVDAPLSVVHDERDRLVEALATFVRGLPEQRVAVLLPAADADPARRRSRRHDVLVDALRVEGCAVRVDRAAAPAEHTPAESAPADGSRKPLVTAA